MDRFQLETAWTHLPTPVRSTGCANVIYPVGKRWSVPEYDYVSELGHNGYLLPTRTCYRWPMAYGAP
eukprot:2626331-Prymnesium_polylepis.1